jgi:hypothetical protein
MAVSQTTEKVKTPEKDMQIDKEKVESLAPTEMMDSNRIAEEIATNIKTPLKPNCKLISFSCHDIKLTNGDTCSYMLLLWNSISFELFISLFQNRSHITAYKNLPKSPFEYQYV